VSLRLNAVTWGVGTPTVLLLHGLGDGAFVWNHIAPILAAHTAVAAVELRGHGDSPHDAQARYEPETHAEDVIEAMKSLVGEGAVTLIGHSLGATVAIHVASMARDRVHGLALLDGGPGLNPSALRHIHEQFLAQPWFHESVESFAAELERRHPLSNAQLLPSIAERALKPLRSGGYELKCDRLLLGSERAPDDALLWEKLRSFDGPVLVVRGAGSAVLGRKAAARMANELPDCRLHTVPVAGHTVMLDNPDDLVPAIERFLSESSRRRRADEAAVS
jgi:pimeloyl-ACP methyl ester carboxylesterase